MNWLSRLTLASLALVAGSAVQAASLEAQMSERIKQSQAQLARTERTVTNEQNKLTKQLNALERDVITLRKESEAARRLADERNLSLDQLQGRLKEWSAQNNYQLNLIQQYLRSQGAELGQESTLDDKTLQLLRTSAQVENWLTPHWQSRDVVLPSGDIRSLKQLDTGPLHWALDGASAYRVAEQEGEWQVLEALSPESSSALTSVQQTGNGSIRFDPSLNTQANAPSESLLEHVERGGLWAMPILLFALVALVIAILKAVQLLRLPAVRQISKNGVVKLLQGQGDALPKGSMQARLLELAQHSDSAAERDDQLLLQLGQDRHQLEKRLTAVAVTASVAPLLGLLGTVSGMIETFRMMTLFGSGNPEVVSGGIAQALITTELGLVVAIPALVIHSLLSRRAKSYYQQLENFALVLASDEQVIKPEQGAASSDAVAQPA
ncbi:MotA/TolQ/ExbB proton channel family protein [Oceanobacter kriegii]|uniref:MotA/TolQ/ExbB proton channel family protein n=1 Tax=Oceanobacter kriegii TaxID=64972 RepID=UPI00042269DF|nr:MotA/TolQ/ExbB proton channel family protein [Oceanobacter kriegii]